MSAEDHAILIGINRYPELGEAGGSADLQGPENDVDAVKAWLLDPKGGEFPDESNIHVQKSVAADSAASAQPKSDELEGLLGRLDQIAQANRKAGKGLRVGRRLYLFMSGHGFSPGRQRGCLYAANATPRQGFNVHATGWLSWLQDSGYFREYVLWMDCCMNRVTFLQPRDPLLPLVNAPDPPRANFVAFAAQRPLKAVEAPIAEDDGRTHGLFTWALLEGLRGAASDANGRVNGRSLADWIRNAQVARMAPGDRDDPDVAREPEVIQEDGGLIFARGVSKPSYAVRLSFPPGMAAGAGRLWSGTPPRVVRQFPLTGAPEDLLLQPGLYLMEVPHAGLRQGFEVLSPLSVAVEEQGPPVSEPAQERFFQLDVDPGDPAAEIFVIDGRFALADGNTSRLSTSLPFGLFKVKIRIGRAARDRVLLLDRDRPPIAPDTIAKPAATVVPILGTAVSHEYHAAGRDDAVRAVQALGVAPNRGAIMVMARVFSSRDSPVAGARPWEGVSVVDAQGQTVLDLEREARRHPGPDPYAIGATAVDPGSYLLRQRLDDHNTIEQSLIVSAGWRLEVYILRRIAPGGVSIDARPRLSVMMRRLGDGPGWDLEDRVIETARVALADERCILNTELEQLLLEKFQDPMAGIIGGHLMLVERERDPSRDLSLLNTVVGNLNTLVGAGHPDVAALALQCPNAKLRRVGRLVGPPMLQRSWSLLVRGAQKRADLIPAAMWDRVQALTALPPFLAWSTDEEVKAASRNELALTILGGRVAEPSPPAHGGLEALLPPAAPSPGFRGTGRRTPQRGPIPAGSPTRAKRRAARLDVPPSALDSLRKAIR